MSKRVFKQLMCLISAFVLIAALSACGSDPKESAPEDGQSTGQSGPGAEGPGNTGASADVSGQTDDSPSPGSTGGNGNGTTSKGGTTAKGNPTGTTSATTGASRPTSLSRDQVMGRMPAKLKNTKLKYFIWEDPRNQVQKSAIEGFQKATGITLEVEIASKSEYNNQLAARIASKKSPDMGLMIQNVSNTVINFQPITKSGFNFNDTAWDTDLMKDFTFNGNLYGINLKNTPIRNMGIILYNKTALRRAEMEDPYAIWSKDPSKWTWVKLWSMCDEFLQANKRKEGFYGINFSIADGYPRSFGASFFSYDNAQSKFVSNIKSSETIKRFETLVDMTTGKKCAAPSDDANGFIMGNILFAFSYSSIVEKQSSGYSQIRKNMGCVPVPSDSTVQPLYEYYAYGIPIGAGNPEAVPYYVRYVLDAQGYDMNDFYMNDDAKKVVESMTASGKFYMGYGYTWAIWNELLGGTSAQVRSILEANNGTIQTQIDDYNRQILTLNK